MKRPSLVFGLTAFTIASLFFILGSSALVVALIISVAVLLFYSFSKHEKVKSIFLIPVITICVIISSASVFLNNFLVYEKAVKQNASTADIVATVIEKNENQYILKTSYINNEKENIKISFATKEKNYELYDILFLNDAYLTKTDFEKNADSKLFLSVKNFESSEKFGENKRDFYYYITTLKSTCLDKLSDYLFLDLYGLASGMLFGGSNNLSDELTVSFRASGVAHLLAVSGLHASLWCGLFISLLKFLKVKEKYANLFGIFILLVLMIISGFTPSVTRASFMMGLTLIAPLFKRRADAVNSLGFAAALILIINPYVIFSASFYLSFLATLGVVLSTNLSFKVKPFISTSKAPLFIKRALLFIVESLIVSFFATIFTLPATVYYFGTVSIIAPITNLLTINLAFITMVITLISLCTSFIPLSFLTPVNELLFAIDDFLLQLLAKIITATGSLKYASVSVNDSFVYTGIAITIFFICTFYFVFSKKVLKPITRKISTVVVILPIIISIILSVIPFKANTEFTILSGTNTPNIIIRCGTSYAIINTPEAFSENEYKRLPKVKSESIELLAVTVLRKSFIEKLERLDSTFKIERKMLTSFNNSILNNYDTDVFALAEVSDDFTCTLKNQINIRIFNTYGKNCAIIEFNEKIIVLSFSEYNDLNAIKKETGKIDVLVLSGNIPDSYNTIVDTLVVCSADEVTTHKNDHLGFLYADKYLKTSTEGDINFN